MKHRAEKVILIIFAVAIAIYAVINFAIIPIKEHFETMQANQEWLADLQAEAATSRKEKETKAYTYKGQRYNSGGISFRKLCYDEETIGVEISIDFYKCMVGFADTSLRRDVWLIGFLDEKTNKLYLWSVSPTTDEVINGEWKKPKNYDTVQSLLFLDNDSVRIKLTEEEKKQAFEQWRKRGKDIPENDDLEERQIADQKLREYLDTHFSKLPDNHELYPAVTRALAKYDVYFCFDKDRTVQPLDITLDPTEDASWLQYKKQSYDQDVLRKIDHYIFM